MTHIQTAVCQSHIHVLTSLKASIPASLSFQLVSASCLSTVSEIISAALASTSSGYNESMMWSTIVKVSERFCSFYDPMEYGVAYC